MPSDQEQADQIVSGVERAVADATRRASSFLIRLAARTREEAEDIWAEAKSMSERRS